MSTTDPTPEPSHTPSQISQPKGKSRKHDGPDFTKPLSRWSAPYWAMKHGICAALGGDARWAVLTALYTFLPNVEPSRETLEQLTGKARSTVDAARLSLHKVGLISYDASKGGRFHTPRYEIADIRQRDVADAIIERITKGSDHRQKGSDERTLSSNNKGSDLRQKGSDDRRKGSDERQKGSDHRTRSTQQSSQPTSQAKPFAATPLLGGDASSDRSGVAVAEVTPSAIDQSAPALVATAEGHTSQRAEGGFARASSSDVPQGVKNSSSPSGDDAPHAPPAKQQRRSIPKSARAARGAAANQPDNLSGEQRAAVCASSAAMEGYLLWGVDGIGNPKANDLPPSRMNWRQYGTPEEPNYEAWTIPAFMGFYWWRVSASRESRGIQITLPLWSRMAGDFKNILATLPNKAEFHKMLRYLCMHFDLICSMSGRAGGTIALNEASLTNGIIRDKLQVIMNAQQPQLDTLYAELRRQLGLEN